MAVYQEKIAMLIFNASLVHVLRQGTIVHSCLSSLSHCGLSSGIGARELISTFKKSAGKKWWFVEPSPKVLACEEKATTICTREYGRHGQMKAVFLQQHIIYIDTHISSVSYRSHHKRDTNPFCSEHTTASHTVLNRIAFLQLLHQLSLKIVL